MCSVRTLASIALLALAAAGLSCGGPAGDRTPELIGSWRAFLESPGGELPFDLRIDSRQDGQLVAKLINGAGEAPVTGVEIDGDRVTLRFDHYDARIIATLSAGGDELAGRWTRQSLRYVDKMMFRARRRSGADDLPRFGPLKSPGRSRGVTDVSGEWDVVFTDEEQRSPARAIFHQDGTHAWGTFLTPTGDYRYLDGDYRDGILRLSSFDGGREAYLFMAQARDDGSIEGDWWARATYHATWRAKRRRAGSEMEKPGWIDSFSMTTLSNPTGRLNFSFPDLEGRTVSSSDPRFEGKVLLVDIFGSWCFNCNDEAPLLVDYYRRYRDRGLEIVGLAYELRDDPEANAVFVRRFAERHGITFPLLLAGTSDKTEASATLPDLAGVLAFPTLIFVGRDGLVKAIHTGFDGPATGRHYDDLKAQYQELIESLL